MARWSRGSFARCRRVASLLANQVMSSTHAVEYHRRQPRSQCGDRVQKRRYDHIGLASIRGSEAFSSAAAATVEHDSPDVLAVLTAVRNAYGGMWRYTAVQ